VAYFDELIASVSDAQLRRSLAGELSRLKARMSFGLVFERHIPETGVLPGLRPRRGSLVAVRDNLQRTYVVEELTESKAVLCDSTDGTSREVGLEDVLMVASFGRPIYPALTSLGSIERSSERPSHSVINGENYHALQLLTYLLADQVDCIYIDPPYNTGARDWTYNNHFVDRNDSYRHSKWLSFMEKRMRLARRLLKPDGVLIVTVDENEVRHLGMLLEQLFPDALLQMVSICINPSGASGEGLSRVDEYAFFCFFGTSRPVAVSDDMLTETTSKREVAIRWESLMRGGNAWYRASRPNLCYPILLDPHGRSIVGVGEPLPFRRERDADDQEERERPTVIDGCPVAWPVRLDGKLGIWRVDAARLMQLVEKGYAYVSSTDTERGTWTIRYVMSGTIDAIDAGLIEVLGTGERGQALLRRTAARRTTAKTVWHRGRHTAGGAGGTHLLVALLGERDLFPFPKSVYAVRDCIEVAVGDRPNALILDFFAGSGTTLQATCMLNREDGGQRRCILVTNNEVEEKQAINLNKQGFFKGDPEFEAHGIFERVTVPRCSAALTGETAKGIPTPGNYLDGTPYRDGFEENAQFFRLDYLDKDEVELGRAFEAINPCLWLMSGSRGTNRLNEVANQGWAIAEGGAYAVLFDETRLRSFKKALSCSTAVERVFLVTDSEEAYAEMAEALGGRWPTSMLYRDYLRNFQINTEETQ